MGDPTGSHRSHGQVHWHLSPELRADGHRRLLLIEGQVRGLQRMLEDDRYCVDVITQIEAVREALRQVGRRVLRNYLENCVADAVRRGETAIFDEAEEVWNKFSR